MRWGLPWVPEPSLFGEASRPGPAEFLLLLPCVPLLPSAQPLGAASSLCRGHLHRLHQSPLLAPESFPGMEWQDPLWWRHWHFCGHQWRDCVGGTVSPVLDPQSDGGVNTLERPQWRAIKADRGGKSTCCMKRGWVSRICLSWRRNCKGRDLFAVCSYQLGGCGARLLSEEHRKRTKAIDGLLQEKFWSGTRKSITERLIKHWNRLPRDMGSPSLDTLKTELDMALSNFFWLDLLWAGELLRPPPTWIFGEFYNLENSSQNRQYGCFHWTVSLAVRKEPLCTTVPGSRPSDSSSRGPGCSFPLVSSIYFCPPHPAPHQAAKNYLEEGFERVLVQYLEHTEVRKMNEIFPQQGNLHQERSSPGLEPGPIVCWVWEGPSALQCPRRRRRLGGGWEVVAQTEMSQR